MKFPFTFYRGGLNQPALGSDVDPPVLPPDQTVQTKNYFDIRFCENETRWPVHRIAVAYKAPVGSTTPVTAKLFVWDTGLEVWLQIGPMAGVTIEANSIGFFDSVVLCQHAITRAEMEKSVGSAATYYVAIADNGVAGEHGFGVGGDLSTIGYN